MKKLKEQIEKEKDKDIQAELRKGNIVEIIESSFRLLELVAVCLIV
jgi:hypothetical protein